MFLLAAITPASFVMHQDTGNVGLRVISGIFLTITTVVVAALVIRTPTAGVCGQICSLDA